MKILCLLALLSLPALAETCTAPVYLGTNLVVNVPSNAVVEVLSVTPQEFVQCTVSNAVFLAYIPAYNGGQPYGEWHLPLVIAGPVQLSFGRAEGFVTYRITAQTPAASSVIVPAGTSARIAVERSQDLLTWSSVVPGTITNAPSNLFFRLRADRL